MNINIKSIETGNIIKKSRKLTEKIRKSSGIDTRIIYYYYLLVYSYYTIILVLKCFYCDKRITTRVNRPDYILWYSIIIIVELFHYTLLLSI